jgi:hypothetical protein
MGAGFADGRHHTTSARLRLIRQTTPPDAIVQMEPVCGANVTNILTFAARRMAAGLISAAQAAYTERSDRVRHRTPPAMPAKPPVGQVLGTISSSR